MSETFKQSVEKQRLQRRTDDDSRLKANSLYARAIKYLDKPTDMEQLRSIDMTGMFEEEFEIMIKKGEYVNININGLPSSGKSTVGIQLAIIGMKYLNKEISLWNISRDQTEYGRRIRDSPNEVDTFMLIDEWNEMETTGFNATKRQAFLETESDLLGQRKIRKISCSPKNQVDKNAFIFLEVITTDIDGMKTRCHLYYKTYLGGMEYQQLLGYVDIDVREAIENEIYKTYRRRKFERMDLLIKEGIDSPERLYHAEIINGIINDLAPIARMGNVNRSFIKIKVDEYAIQRKELFSIIGREEIIDTVKGILDAEKELGEIKRKIKKSETMKSNILLNEQVKEMKKAEALLQNSLNVSYDNLKKMMRLLKEYKKL